jgi:hypothetical protein
MQCAVLYTYIAAYKSFRPMQCIQLQGGRGGSILIQNIYNYTPDYRCRILQVTVVIFTAMIISNILSNSASQNQK